MGQKAHVHPAQNGDYFVPLFIGLLYRHNGVPVGVFAVITDVPGADVYHRGYLSTGVQHGWHTVRMYQCHKSAVLEIHISLHGIVPKKHLSIGAQSSSTIISPKLL